MAIVNLMPRGADIFCSNADLLAAPVNCVGVMGKGLALTFKRRYGDPLFLHYKMLCITRQIDQSEWLHLWHAGSGTYVCLFPTKRHWREKSSMPPITRRLGRLASQVQLMDLKRIALPALGCGLGGLPFEDIRRAIESAFERADCTVLLFPPHEIGEPADA